MEALWIAAVVVLATISLGLTVWAGAHVRREEARLRACLVEVRRLHARVAELEAKLRAERAMEDSAELRRRPRASGG